MTRTLDRHDITALAERRRRHLVTTLDSFTGCRCCFDPNSDGGEYAALIELREKRMKLLQSNYIDGDEEEKEQEN